MKQLIAVLLLGMVSSQAFAADGDMIVGKYWNDERTSILEIYQTGDTFEGKVVWRSEPFIDSNNPDESLQSRSLINVPIITGFVYDAEDDRLEDGEVYAPDDGKTYSGNIWLEDDSQTLKMRGYIGISLFGRTREFTRMTPGEEVPQ